MTHGTGPSFFFSSLLRRAIGSGESAIQAPRKIVKPDLGEMDLSRRVNRKIFDNVPSRDGHLFADVVLPVFVVVPFQKERICTGGILYLGSVTPWRETVFRHRGCSRTVSSRRE